MQHEPLAAAHDAVRAIWRRGTRPEVANTVI